MLKHTIYLVMMLLRTDWALQWGHATLDEFKKQLAQHRDNVAKLFADAFVLKKHQAELDQDGANLAVWTRQLNIWL
jgi:hypothetical protein